MGLNSAPILNNVKKPRCFGPASPRHLSLWFSSGLHICSGLPANADHLQLKKVFGLWQTYILSPLASQTVRFCSASLPISKTRTQLGNKKSVALKIEFCCPYLPQGGSAHIGKPSLSFFFFLWITLQIITSNLIVPLLNPKIFSSGNIYIWKKLLSTFQAFHKKRKIYIYLHLSQVHGL